MEGVTYDCFASPPTDEEIIGRLIQSPEDKHPVVKKRLEHFRRFVPEMEREWSDKIIRINADKDSQAVFESVCESFI